MNTLFELAERCERATGPDIGIDVLIAEAVRWKDGLVFQVRTWSRHNTTDALVADVKMGGYLQGLPAYTASLDAAMMLVPDGFGWWFSCGKVRPDGKPPEVNESFAQVWQSLKQGVFRGGDPHGKVANPALALCAAALRARAAGEQP